MRAVLLNGPSSLAFEQRGEPKGICTLAPQQSCPTFRASKTQTWPSVKELDEKLWGTGDSPSADSGFRVANRPDNLNGWPGNAGEEEEEKEEPLSVFLPTERFTSRPNQLI